MEKRKEYEILETNLQPFFWRKSKNIIRQNKKAALQEFLFGKDVDRKPDNQASNTITQILEDQIQNLQNQVDLETKLMKVEQNSKHTLSGPLQLLESSKTIQEELFLTSERSEIYIQIKRKTLMDRISSLFGTSPHTAHGFGWKDFRR